MSLKYNAAKIPILHLLVLLFLVLPLLPNDGGAPEPLFVEDFEKGLGRWEVSNFFRVRTVDSGDPDHGRVLCLYPGGAGVRALIKGSGNWGPLRIEGEVFFPFNRDYALGVIYHFHRRGPRVDFDCISIHGPFADDFGALLTDGPRYREFPPARPIGSMILVQPHWDGVSRGPIYPEYRVVSRKEKLLGPGVWHRFKAEIKGPVCHFYVGDMQTPGLTFDLSPGRPNGLVGFKPIDRGAVCWIDNIRVTPLKTPGYSGRPRPSGIRYNRRAMLVRWHAVGPFYERIPAIETRDFVPDRRYGDLEYREGGRVHHWKKIDADPRGCVLVGPLYDKFSGRRYTYLHTRIFSMTDARIKLHFSSAVPLTVWLNNREAGEIRAGPAAWYDFMQNPGHKGQSLTVDLRIGPNDLLILVKGGARRGDGFYVHAGGNIDHLDHR